MKKKDRIWVDLTDMLLWSGTFTGIQRVIYEYAVRFEKDQARFFAYDAPDKRFIEINLSDVGNEKSVNGGKIKVSRKRWLRQFLGKPYYNLPDRYRAFLHPYVFALNHTVRTVLHLLKVGKTVFFRGSQVRTSHYRNKPEAIFRDNETIVLLGAGWNDSRTLDALIKYKEHTNIRISQHINDILPIYQPQLFADDLPAVFTPYVEKVINNADIISVISESTKRDVEIFCSERIVRNNLDVKVVRLGDNPDISIQASCPADARIKPNKFLLSVGTFEIRKNYILLYQAVKLAQIENREIPVLVIAGRSGWLSGDVRHVLTRDPFVSDHIIWLNNVSDAELKWLYQNCMFTIFPSIAEGWGLPIAESLNYGKFCLVSGVSAMLEIGIDMVDYFLPYDPRECMEKIQYYLAESRYRDKNKQIATKYKAFTWDDSYDQLR